MTCPNANEHRRTERPVKCRPAFANTALLTTHPMKELLRTNDPVRLSYVEAILKAAGIASVVLDQHTSIIEGSIGAIQRRIMVGDDDLERARGVLAGTGEAPR